MSRLLWVVLLVIALAGAGDLLMDAPRHWLSLHTIFELSLTAASVVGVVAFWLAWWNARASADALEHNLQQQAAGIKRSMRSQRIWLITYSILAAGVLIIATWHEHIPLGWLWTAAYLATALAATAATVVSTLASGKRLPMNARRWLMGLRCRAAMPLMPTPTFAMPRPFGNTQRYPMGAISCPKSTLTHNRPR